jgi:hypothetical protein
MMKMMCLIFDFRSPALTMLTVTVAMAVPPELPVAVAV